MSPRLPKARSCRAGHRNLFTGSRVRTMSGEGGKLFFRKVSKTSHLQGSVSLASIAAAAGEALFNQRVKWIVNLCGNPTAASVEPGMLMPSHDVGICSRTTGILVGA